MQGGVPHADAREDMREGAVAQVDTQRRIVDVANCRYYLPEDPSIIDWD
jgi:hypothetical protein